MIINVPFYKWSNLGCIHVDWLKELLGGLENQVGGYVLRSTTKIMAYNQSGEDTSAAVWELTVRWHCWWHWELEATTGMVATADARSWVLLSTPLPLSVMMLHHLYLFFSSWFDILDSALDWLYLDHVLRPILKGD